MTPPQPPLGATPEPTHCDSCDWTFDCWNSPSRCRKRAPEPSKTPRTDAEARSLEWWQFSCDDNVHLVSAKLASTIETELSTARAALAQCKATLKETRDYLTDQDVRASEAETALAQCEERLRKAEWINKSFDDLNAAPAKPSDAKKDTP
jgi:hypothetical protein